MMGLGGFRLSATQSRTVPRGEARPKGVEAEADGPKEAELVEAPAAVEASEGESPAPATDEAVSSGRRRRARPMAQSIGAAPLRERALRSFKRMVDMFEYKQADLSRLTRNECYAAAVAAFCSEFAGDRVRLKVSAEAVRDLARAVELSLTAASSSADDELIDLKSFEAAIQQHLPHLRERLAGVIGLSPHFAASPLSSSAEEASSLPADMMVSWPIPSHLTVEERPSPPSLGSLAGSRASASFSELSGAPRRPSARFSELQDASDGVRIYAASESGKKPHNEDVVVVVDRADVLADLAGTDASQLPRLQYAAVLDGHGGRQAAVYAAVHLYHRVLAHSGPALHDFEAAVHAAFVEVDARFCAHAEAEGVNSGTTATAVFMTDDWLVVAGCGDGLVFGFGASAEDDAAAVPLVPPHSLSDPQERARVEASGAKVLFNGTWRVQGVLAVTRSIGDRNLRNAVIPDPAIRTIPRSGSSAPRFLVLASDGLWDVLSPSDVGDLVRAALASDAAESSVAADLVRCAIDRGSSDNVSAIVILL